MTFKIVNVDVAGRAVFVADRWTKTAVGWPLPLLLFPIAINAAERKTSCAQRNGDGFNRHRLCDLDVHLTIKRTRANSVGGMNR